MMDTTTLDRATPTQRQCIERSRAFHASIAAHAVAQKPAPERSFAVRGDYVPPPKQTLEVPPQASPAEPCPPVHLCELSLEGIVDVWPVVFPRKQLPVSEIEHIQRVVCRHLGILLRDMISDRRTKNVVWPRQVAMYLAKVMTSLSLPAIGRRFGNRDHTTVLHAVRKVERLMKEDLRVGEVVRKLLVILERQ